MDSGILGMKEYICRKHLNIMRSAVWVEGGGTPPVYLQQTLKECTRLGAGDYLHVWLQ